MNLPKKGLLPRLSTAALIGFVLPSFAQETKDVPTPVVEQKPPGKEEVVTMTPFEVVSSEDRGYAAQSTLAGTRLNTRLSDISSPIQVLTSAFLDDIGATNAESILTYATNTEIGGLGGNLYEAPANLGNANGVFTGPENRGNFSGRVRGLRGPDRTRNYFQSDIPLDTYNLQSVDIQRGPNSILFGLGSPAGIVNSSFKQPNTNKTSAKLEFKTDRWGSARTVVDANIVAIPGVLALRVIGLGNETRYEQEPAWAKDNRLTGMVRYTPKLFKGVTTDINAAFEVGSGNSNKPDTAPPIDAISPWYNQLNKWEQPNGGWVGNFATIPSLEPYLNSSSHTSWDNLSALIFADPNSSVTGYGPGLVDGTRRNGTALPGSGSTAQSQYIGVRNPTSGANFASHFLSQRSYYANNPAVLAIIADYERLSGRTWTEASGLGWRNAQILDRSIFDYKTDMLSGPSNIDWQSFDTINASLRQTYLGGDLGYELTFDQQNYHNKSAYLMARADTIEIEINRKLRDNVTENPNFGRPLVAARTSGQMQWRDRQSFRGQAYYNLDFDKVPRIRDSKLASILGKHTFTGALSRQEYHQFQYGFWPIKWGDGYTANNGAQDVYFGVHYLDAAVNTRTATTLAGAGISGLGVAQVPKLTDLRLSSVVNNNLVNTGGNDLWFWDAPEGHLRNIHNSSDKEIKSQTGSKVFVWQSRLFSDHVIGLFGYRSDDFKRWQKPVINTDPRNLYTPGNGIHNSVGNPYSQYWVYNEPFQSEGATRSYGIMVHSPDFINRRLPRGMKISVGYNEATNFDPANATTNPFGKQNPTTTGETQDYTVQLRMLDDRLTLRYTRFKTNQSNVTDTGSITGIAQAMKLRIVRALNGMHLEAQTGGSTLNSNPEWIINKWMFGSLSASDKAIENTPLPSDWTVQNHPELLGQPLRIRAAYFGADQGGKSNPSLNQPVLSAAEIAYRTAWFKARTEAAWYRPFGKELFDAFGLKPDYGKSGGWFPESTNSTVAAITNQESEGDELELVYNPLPNWRMMVSASKTKAADTDAWSNLAEYMEAFMPVAYDGYNPAIPRGTTIRYWDRTGFAHLDGFGNGNTEMLGWQWYNDVYRQYLTKKAQDGLSIEQLRPKRFSFTTNYDFRSGALKGVGLGGSVRWEDSIVLGYFRRYDPTLQNWIDDVTKPIRGDANTSVDAWVSYSRRLTDRVNWRIQLNARDLLSRDDLIPVASNGDGSVGSWRIRASTAWELTNRFEF